MTNSEISQALIKAKIKNNRLWDLPRPNWTKKDFNELERLIKGKRIHKYNYIKKVKKSVIRESDFKKYDSVKEAAIDNNINLSMMYYLIKKGLNFRLS